ncbi:MAG: pyridoxal phosphate-dependent aminotransferase, partial [Promethearchaeota archaeon]
MQLSKVAKRIKPSATLAINELITQRRRQGEQILHMGFGESPFPVHPLVRKALCENAGQKSYLATQGIKPLREQISKFYEKVFNLQYPAEQIVVGPGSKVLLYDALVALDGPLFLPAPSWVSYQHQARLLGKEVYHVKTSPEDSYRLTPDALEQSLQQNTPNPWDQKVLLLNYPCNPTGHSYSAQQLKALAKVAKDYNVIVLSDEIYGLVSFSDQEHHSIAEFYREGTLVTGGLSKDRSLGGFRVGVMLFPEDEQPLVTSICSIGSETWSCVAAPVQYAAIQAYQTTPAILNFIYDCAQIHELATRFV